MTTSKDFDFFLRNGFIEGLEPGTSMEVLLTEFGSDRWGTKNIENNGLIYGIINIGFIEFHIYNEKISGISYRPDFGFNKKEFNKGPIPWILKIRKISDVESKLLDQAIEYKKIIVTGPSSLFKTAGASMFLDSGEHTFIDTIGGVTFIFETDVRTGRLIARQICKYYIMQ